MSPTPLPARLKNGDPSAFEEIFTALNSTLIRVAASITGNRATAEEVTQETWLAVIENLGTYRGDAPLRHWILRILSNKARTRATRDGKTEPLDTFQVGFPDQFTESGDWAVAPSLWEEITPERILSGRQTWELVQEEIRNLPSSQQAVLSLFEHEKMSSGECAEILGMTPANVRVQLHRAREKIRQVLDAEASK
jgi:RNA polymerase sigma-70 factor (ECF subfamily)